MMPLLIICRKRMEKTRRRRRSSHGITVAEANVERPLPSVLRKSRRPFTPEACSEQVYCTYCCNLQRAIPDCVCVSSFDRQEMQDKLMDIYAAIFRGEPYKQVDRKEKGLHKEKPREQPNNISQLWYRHPLEGLRVSKTPCPLQPSLKPLAFTTFSRVIC